MNNFILIAFFYFSGSPGGAISQEFGSEEACRSAVHQLEIEKPGHVYMTAICIPKGGGY